MNHDEFCPNQNYITLFYKTTVNFKCRDENVFLKFLTFAPWTSQEFGTG